MSTIQSEAEVRSKLIVPLIGCLGYPSMNRAEEFPVYGWQGRNELPAKYPDFLLLSDKDFAGNKTRSINHIRWVQDHCLLVIEAKKPEEMPNVDGQVMFYTQWTKALAYITCDGRSIRCFYYSKGTSDIEHINCPIQHLSDELHLDDFSYDTLFDLKQQLLFRKMRCESVFWAEDSISEDEINYMADAISADRNEISHSEVIRRFQKFKDTIIDCDLRYDIPPFAFDVPRRTVGAKLYIENVVSPHFCGEAVHYYWHDLDQFSFSNGYISVYFLLRNNVVVQMGFGYSVLDRQATRRFSKLKMIKAVFEAKDICMVLDDGTRYIMRIGCLCQSKIQSKAHRKFSHL